MWLCNLKKRLETGGCRPEGWIRVVSPATARCGLPSAAFGLCLALLGLTGCATLNPQPPVEHFANQLADEAIIPAVREGLAQGVEQLVIQAGAQGINPTYIVKFSGKWVTGVEGAASVGVEGIAGQLQVSSTSNEETESSSPQASRRGEPHQEDNAGLPATQPAATAPRSSVPGAP